MELLRDRRAEFDEAGVQPVGISRDSPYTHIAWTQALDLNFGLLSDFNGDAVCRFGIGFEFPIVVVFLQLIGVVNSRQLRDFRRFALVIITIIAAVITPSTDPYSMLALAIPMMIFYEVSIVIGRIRERRLRKAAAAARATPEAA